MGCEGRTWTSTLDSRLIDSRLIGSFIKTIVIHLTNVVHTFVSRSDLIKEPFLFFHKDERRIAFPRTYFRKCCNYYCTPWSTFKSTYISNLQMRKIRFKEPSFMTPEFVHIRIIWGLKISMLYPVYALNRSIYHNLWKEGIDNIFWSFQEISLYREVWGTTGPSHFFLSYTLCGKICYPLWEGAVFGNIRRNGITFLKSRPSLPHTYTSMHARTHTCTQHSSEELWTNISETALGNKGVI